MPRLPSKETVFVRSMSTATPEEVVEAAKKAGLKLDLDRVAKVRDYDLARARLKAKKEGGKVHEKPRAAAAPPGHEGEVPEDGGQEDRVRALEERRPGNRGWAGCLSRA